MSQAGITGTHREDIGIHRGPRLGVTWRLFGKDPMSKTEQSIDELAGLRTVSFGSQFRGGDIEVYRGIWGYTGVYMGVWGGYMEGIEGYISI